MSTVPWSRLGIAASLVLISGVAFAADGRPSRKLTFDPEARRVDLFDAQREGLVSIRVVPRDEKQATVTIVNETKSPLTVEVPKAVAAVHVLKQFQQPFPQGNNANPNDPYNAQGSAQSVGGQMFGFPQQGQNSNGFSPFGQNFFSIPAEKAVQLQLQSVCLDHGKPTPTTRMKYELKRMEEMTDNASLIELIEKNDFRVTHRATMQAAAWHLSNKIPFEQLATKMSGVGVLQPYFNAGQLQDAQKLVKTAQADAEKRPASSRPESR